MVNTDSGFDYFFLQNNEPGTTATITLDLVGCKNAMVMPPYSGDKPQITLQPMSNAAVVLQATKLPYEVKARILANFKQAKVMDNLKEQLRKSK